MTNYFQRADAFIRKKRKQIASVEVIYVRGEEELPVSATLGRSAHEQEPSDDGPNVMFESEDFLIDVADLVSLGLPRSGDEVRYLGVSGEYLTYAILPSGTDAFYRYADSSRSVYRLHAKLFGRVDANGCLLNEDGGTRLNEDGGIHLLED